MFNFALVGAAGYIAPRHMKAIKDTGNKLVTALDKHDAVGVIDSYFPDADFFVEFERFDRHAEKLKRQGDERRIHYVSIASPNYLHDAHIRFALRVGAHAICEKPLVLFPKNVDVLKEIEREYGRKVNAILQLRLHPSIVALKEKVDSAAISLSPLALRRKYDIDLTYITARGQWYLYSWKGNLEKSGGIATNIGIHFFDMLQWIFGKVQFNIVHLLRPTKAAGFLELEKARVRWFLSVDRNDLPQKVKVGGKATYRSITIDGKEVEFSDGFADLHTASYKSVLTGGGFGLEDARPSIETVFEIRSGNEAPLKGEYHPYLKLIER